MSGGASVVEALFGAFWALERGKFYAMLDFLESRAAGERFSAAEIAARVGEGRSRQVQPKGDGVAVLPVYGIISHRAHMVQNTSGPGGTSTEVLGNEFDAALNDPSVKAIVLDIASPGGNVHGVQELADKIYAARGVKPIVAVANALAASAAYWIGTAAEQLVVSPSGEVGSIGVYAVHTDTSRRDANAGVTRTVLAAGEHKAEGVAGPLSSDAIAHQLERLNAFRDAFGQAVARGRGVPLATALGPKFGQGRTLLAQQAVALGMADRVATLEDVLAEFGVGAKSKSRPLGKPAAAAIAAAEDLAPAAAVGRLIEEAPDDAALAAVLEGAGIRAGDDFPEFSRAVTRAIAAVLPDSFVPREFAAAGDAGVGLSREGAAPVVLAAAGREDLSTKEHEVTATSHAGTPAQADDATAAVSRQVRIQELCTLAGSSMADYVAYVGGTMTPEQVRADLQTKRGTPAPVAIGGMTDREADRPFATIGEQLIAIVQAGMPTGRVDRRLLAINAAASGMNEGVGSEGGFFLQADLLPGVLAPVYADDPLLSRVHKVPIGAGKNGVKYNVIDETSRATGSRLGGIQMYWVAEAETATAKKPKLRQIVQELKKLLGIGYLTDEMMEDAPAAGDLLTTAFQSELRFMLGDGIFRGTGVGQMAGFLTSGALSTVAIEATQTIANTPSFIATNTSKLLSRIPAALWGETIFLYNAELFPSIAAATIGNTPVFVGPNGMAGAPMGTIWGRPAFPSELCEAVGTPGDLVCIAPSQYHLADKGAQNGNVTYSPHVRFLYDEQTMKITHRVDGKPIWNTTLTPYKGAGARSPFQVLATRS